MAGNGAVATIYTEADIALELLKKALAEENKKELKQKEETQRASKADTSN